MTDPLMTKLAIVSFVVVFPVYMTMSIQMLK